MRSLPAYSAESVVRPCEIMALPKDLCDLYALETPLLLARQRAQKRRQQCVNDILSKRQMFGEFSHMWNDLEKDESQYFFISA
jgi:hypothetical protein